ncbi:MAG: hypothetical protein K2G91_01735 [Prevotella sp.]|nr:hypothetical protein [Prevotella sp.]
MCIVKQLRELLDLEKDDKDDILSMAGKQGMKMDFVFVFFDYLSVAN